MSKHSRGNPVDCDSIRELIPDYAFGLTDAEETQRVRSGFAHCPEARDELADFRRLRAELMLAVPQMEPPAALGERLMAVIASPIVPVKPHRRPAQWPRIAAAVEALLLLTTNLYWLLRVNDLTRRQDELAAEIARQPPNVFILSNTSSLRWVRLPPSQQNASTSAFLMWNAESETGLLYARGFPKLAAGTTYQLWLTRGDEKVSGGTFHVDADGNGALLFHTEQPIDEYTWARITSLTGVGY